MLSQSFANQRMITSPGSGGTEVPREVVAFRTGEDKDGHEHCQQASWLHVVRVLNGSFRGLGVRFYLGPFKTLNPKP